MNNNTDKLLDCEHANTTGHASADDWECLDCGEDIDNPLIPSPDDMWDDLAPSLWCDICSRPTDHVGEH